MKIEHTATPWRVDQQGREEKWPGIEAGNQTIVIFGTDEDDGGVRGETEEQALANARRIVACVNMMPEVEEFLRYLAINIGFAHPAYLKEKVRAFSAKLKDAAL